MKTLKLPLLFVLALVALMVPAANDAVTMRPVALVLQPSDQKGDFLTNPTCPAGTTGYPNASASVRTACREGVRARGYNVQYVSIASSTKNWFTDLTGFTARLQELVDDGITPVVFLTSDTGSWRNGSLSSIESDLSSYIPSIDSLVGSYVLGIEVDEYWAQSETNSIGNYMQGLTTKLISVHEREGKWDYCAGQSWCDYMSLQYGFGLTPAQVANETQDAISDLGSKPVLAAEYSVGAEADSIELGDAAVAAGAVGFGNGGTAGLIGDMSVKDPSNAGDWAVKTDIEVGSKQYGDRPYTITSLPANLVGIPWIQTANDSKSYTSSPTVTFKVTQDSTVYVAHDDRITGKPSWLSTWTDTGSDLVSSKASQHPRGGNPAPATTTYSLYEHAFTAGTTVSLGNNGGPPISMYTVLVAGS